MNKSVFEEIKKPKEYYTKYFKKLKMKTLSHPIIICDDKGIQQGKVQVFKRKPSPNKRCILGFVNSYTIPDEDLHISVIKDHLIMEVMENCDVESLIEDPVTINSMLPKTNECDDYVTIRYKVHQDYVTEESIIPSLMNLFNESRFPNVDWDNLKTFMKPDNDNVVSMDQFRPTP